MKKIFIIIIFLIQILIFSQEQNKLNKNNKNPSEIQLETDVHPLLTQSSYDLLIDEYPEFFCSKLSPYLPTVLQSSYDEDIQDIVYGNSGYQTTFNHFWNADDGDNSTFDFLDGTSNPNAYQKAKVFIFGQDDNGHKIIYIAGSAFANEAISGVPSNRNGLYISYNSIFDFYINGTYSVYGYQASNGQPVFGSFGWHTLTCPGSA